MDAPCFSSGCGSLLTMGIPRTDLHGLGHQLFPSKGIFANYIGCKRQGKTQSTSVNAVLVLRNWSLCHLCVQSVVVGSFSYKQKSKLCHFGAIKTQLLRDNFVNHKRTRLRHSWMPIQCVRLCGSNSWQVCISFGCWLWNWQHHQGNVKQSLPFFAWLWCHCRSRHLRGQITQYQTCCQKWILAAIGLEWVAGCTHVYFHFDMKAFLVLTVPLVWWWVNLLRSVTKLRGSLLF